MQLKPNTNIKKKQERGLISSVVLEISVIAKNLTRKKPKTLNQWASWCAIGAIYVQELQRGGIKLIESHRFFSVENPLEPSLFIITALVLLEHKFQIQANNWKK